MEQETLRHLIRSKLADGRLPQDSIPRVWGGAGNGETCDACEEIITKTQFVMEARRREAGAFSFTWGAFTSGTPSETRQVGHERRRERGCSELPEVRPRARNGDQAGRRQDPGVLPMSRM